MKNFLSLAAAAMLITNVMSGQNVGIGTISPQARLHIEGGLLLNGFNGSTPINGPGARMMWIPAKSSFRAGEVISSQWDDVNIGYFSIAMGFNTTASANNSSAIGTNTTANANGSTAIGFTAAASGTVSTAMGFATKSKSHGGFVVGLFNDSSNAADPININTLNRIFQIGNGTADNARSNAITVLQNGNVGVGVLNPDLNMVVNNDIRLDAANDNDGSIINSLRFGQINTGEFIASKRTPAGNQWGLDFYTNSISRLSITNSGTVQITNNLTVQNGKGIIRSSDGIQQKKLVKIVTVNASFTAGETKTFAFTWSETFGSAPDAYVGAVAPGSASGWAEVVMTVAADNTTGGTLYVYNPKSTSVSPNFNIKIIAFGPQ